VNVLITFYSLNGATEKLALAAAVGAVQGRAAIRLRRLDPELGESANEERLNQDYVAPKEADARWADAIMVGTPARLSASSPALNKYFELLRSAGVGGKLGAPFVSDAAQVADALEALHRKMAEVGFKMVPLDSSAVEDPNDARMLGRRVAELAGQSNS
jgi:NAD(P)H dehydrogenase (quinone)